MIAVQLQSLVLHKDPGPAAVSVSPDIELDAVGGVHRHQPLVRQRDPELAIGRVVAVSALIPSQATVHPDQER